MVNTPPLSQKSKRQQAIHSREDIQNQTKCLTASTSHTPQWVVTQPRNSCTTNSSIMASNLAALLNRIEGHGRSLLECCRVPSTNIKHDPHAQISVSAGVEGVR